jgi:hypothetical protein
MSDVATSHPDLPALGVITDYASLHEALRRRADQLRLSRTTLDSLTGLADGHSSKLLALSHPKILGEKSFGVMLEALGLRLVVEEDPQALAKYAARCEPRAEHQVRNGHRSHKARIRRKAWLWNTERARRAATARMAALTPRQRRRLARRAALARWQKAREVE